MTRLAVLLLIGLAGIAISGTVSAQEYRIGSPGDEAASAGDIEAAVDSSLGIGIGSPDWRNSDIIERNPLLGLGEVAKSLDRSAVGGVSLLHSDTISFATFFAATGDPEAAAEPRSMLAPARSGFSEAQLFGVGASYRPSAQLTIELSYEALREVDQVLGTPTAVGAAAGDQALTQSLGLGLSYVFNDRLSATVFYDHVRFEADGPSGLLFGGAESHSGQKLGASVSLNRVFTETDQVSVAALQPFNILSSLARSMASLGGEIDSASEGDARSLLIDPEAVPLALSFSYLDSGASIPRGLTFSLEDDDIRDGAGLNVSAVATVKVPF